MSHLKKFHCSFTNSLLPVLTWRQAILSLEKFWGVGREIEITFNSIRYFVGHKSHLALQAWAIRGPFPALVRPAHCGAGSPAEGAAEACTDKSRLVRTNGSEGIPSGRLGTSPILIHIENY